MATSMRGVVEAAHTITIKKMFAALVLLDCMLFKMGFTLLIHMRMLACMDNSIELYNNRGVVIIIICIMPLRPDGSLRQGSRDPTGGSSALSGMLLESEKRNKGLEEKVRKVPPLHCCLIPIQFAGVFV